MPFAHGAQAPPRFAPEDAAKRRLRIGDYRIRLRVHQRFLAVLPVVGRKVAGRVPRSGKLEQCVEIRSAPDRPNRPGSQCEEYARTIRVAFRRRPESSGLPLQRRDERVCLCPMSAEVAERAQVYEDVGIRLIRHQLDANAGRAQRGNERGLIGRSHDDVGVQGDDLLHVDALEVPDARNRAFARKVVGEARDADHLRPGAYREEVVSHRGHEGDDARSARASKQRAGA